MHPILSLCFSLAQQPGGCAILQRENRFIYYLVTKQKCRQKPTYETLEESLKEMKRHCKANNVNHLCMPKIGCGLDGLEWTKVSEIIQNVFNDVAMKITIYDL